VENIPIFYLLNYIFRYLSYRNICKSIQRSAYFMFLNLTVVIPMDGS
jgi:hypothetical protein